MTNRPAYDGRQVAGALKLSLLALLCGGFVFAMPTSAQHIGYDQWQVTDNGGFVAAGLPAKLVPDYSAHAIGFQTNFIVPPKALNFFFKLEEEYRTLARPQGQTAVFGGIYAFRIPKQQPSNP